MSHASRVLTDSLTHALPCMKTFFSKQKLLFLKKKLVDSLRYNSVDNPPIPIDILVLWTTLQKMISTWYSDMIMWTTLRKFLNNSEKYSICMSCTHTRFTRCPCAIEMQMPLYNTSCYMQGRKSTCNNQNSCLSNMLILTFVSHATCMFFKTTITHNTYIIMLVSHQVQQDHFQILIIT